MWIILKWSMPSTGIDQLDKLINDKDDKKGGGMLGITESFIKSMPMIPTPAGELSLSTIGNQIDKFSNGRGFTSKMFSNWDKESDKHMRQAFRLSLSNEKLVELVNGTDGIDFARKLKQTKGEEILTFEKWDGKQITGPILQSAVLKYINKTVHPTQAFSSLQDAWGQVNENSIGKKILDAFNEFFPNNNVTKDTQWDDVQKRNIFANVS